jgi:dihydrofolate synthase/folylpolyglutamate synthase
MLRAAGLRTGCTISPHLIRFNERFLVDGAEIADAELHALVDIVEAAAARVRVSTGMEATFFECGIAVAFEHFRRRQVGVAVVEVGLGGRLDATNVVAPVATALTRISREHEQYLGVGIPAIAAEKCGIIKPGVPVVCGANDDEARAVVAQTARARGAPVVYAEEAAAVTSTHLSPAGQRVNVQTDSAAYGSMNLPLLGDHQLENLATAVLLVERTTEALGVNLTRKAVKQGVEGVRWPGRFTVLGDDPPLVVDGAHNPGAAQALLAAVRRVFNRRPVGLVLGMCADKDETAFLRALAGGVAALWLAPIRSERNMPLDQLAAAAVAAGLKAAQCAAVQDALAAARQWARGASGIVLVAGSLYLVGEVLALEQGAALESPV